MGLFSFSERRAATQETKQGEGVLQKLEALRAQMLNLEVEAAQLDGQLNMRGLERHPNDARLGERLEAAAREYQQLLSQFQQELKTENDRRFNAGEAPLEMTEPTDEEIAAAMRPEYKKAA